jgi:lipid kinase YegS
MEQRRLRLLLNERAATDDNLAQAIAHVRSRGHELDVRALAGRGEAQRLAAEAAQAGFSGVLAAGGDGTLNEVVNGVMKSGGRCAVGVLPFGTANDFAAACGATALPLCDLLLQAAEEAATPIDVCLANDRLFVNAASGGFGAEVTAQTPIWVKDLLGGLAYTLTGALMALNVTACEARMRSPAWAWAGPLLLLAVANGRLAGGGYEVAPRARLDDRLLDIVVIPDIDLAQLPALVQDLFTDATNGLGHVHNFQAPWLEVETANGLHVSVDGEPLFASSFRFEIAAEQMAFYLPHPPKCDLPAVTGLRGT